MCPAPYDCQDISIRSTQTVTALTIAPHTGQSVAGNPSTIATGQLIRGIYRKADTTWYFGT
jgi:hypothetical protein